MAKCERALLFGKIRTGTILLLSPAPLIAVCREEIKASERDLNGHVNCFVVCGLNFLMSKLVLSGSVHVYFLQSVLCEQLSVV